MSPGDGRDDGGDGRRLRLRPATVDDAGEMVGGIERDAAGNHRGQSLYTRLGFVPEGRLRREYLLRGEPHDLIRMALLRDERLAGGSGAGDRHLTACS